MTGLQHINRAPLFSSADYAAVAEYFDARPHLAPTPLHDLPALAARLGIGRLLIKDETARFGLNAFKLLGARFAVDTLVSRGELRAGDTVACASEGNHGRAVARAAREAGCRACVYLAESVAPARIAAIRGEGARVILAAGSYDDAVRQMARDAGTEGWTIISDTSWANYEEIPRLIMLGYTRLMDEVARAPGLPRPDVIFVQGGVGGLLAAVALRSAALWPDDRPRVAAVEPACAASLKASALAGHPVSIPGPFPTMMAGLRCGDVSPLAFNHLQPVVDAYVSIDDQWAARAMRQLARPAGRDPVIRAGASGAAALGGLMACLQSPAHADTREALQLSAAPTAMAIVSEGVTDDSLWAEVMRQA